MAEHISLGMTQAIITCNLFICFPSKGLEWTTLWSTPTAFLATTSTSIRSVSPETKSFVMIPISVGFVLIQSRVRSDKRRAKSNEKNRREIVWVSRVRQRVERRECQLTSDANQCQTSGLFGQNFFYYCQSIRKQNKCIDCINTKTYSLTTSVWNV